MIHDSDSIQPAHNMSRYELLVLEEEHREDIPSPATIKQQQHETWNVARQNYRQDACVHQLVARQAAATPEEIALVAGKRTFSYRELDQRSNQLAHYLQRLGVAPGVLVGLCIERSVDMVIGLLGILKAGGAYVPFDPTYPTERLAFMVEDAQTPVLVTRQVLANTRFNAPGVRIVCLDSDTGELSQQSIFEPTSPVTADDLAYVIYTSGSTGQPKGVQITHRSLLNLVSWHQEAFAVTAADRATQVTSPAFDATGWELWPYLTMGASVHFADEHTRATPALLRDWLVEQRITITFLPTALAESIITLEWPSTTVLRCLLTGADTLRRYPPEGLPFTLINNYGPTEATVVATSGPVPLGAIQQEQPSIGRPIANTQIYMLDENLRQVPTGEPGELYIGGAGLAKGYLNRPELTSQRFIPDPFSNDPGARLYKTGDLARWLPDGQISFLGRIDHQIKIRGYRIEPDEIVAFLNRHPAIQTSVVIAREDISGDKRLVAYVVQSAGKHVTASSLRETLLTSLPDYMIPALFVRMAALPMTPNGKVDRAALPAPDTANTLRDSDIVLPRTPTEARLAQIMASLLGLEQIGIDDNFFMLGGHSLLGTQIIMRVGAAFGVTLSLLILFQSPTIRQLSAEIERQILVRLETMSEAEVSRLLEQ